MRLIKLGVYHPKYLQDFYESHPELRSLPYAMQHSALIGDRYGSSDFWTAALKKLGYETAEIIANAEPLQIAWANENGLAFDEKDWLFEIAAAQIREFRPDVLLVADYSTFTAEFLRSVKRENRTIRLVLGWCGAPHNDSTVFREWDVALSCVPELVTDFNAAGVHSVHVNHAFDPRVLDEIEGGTTPDVDFAFSGSIVKLNRFHIERENLLLHLINHTDLQIWSDVQHRKLDDAGGTSIRRRIAGMVHAGRSAVSGRLFGTSTGRSTLAEPPNQDNNIADEITRRARPPLFGIEMFNRFRNSRVVFNNHIDISRHSASNMRLFEATGVGSCLLTDWKENLSELFEPDKEVLSYESAEECVEKVNYILANESERRSIAAAGQARTLREHTYDIRAEKIDEVIRDVLSL